MDKTHLVFAFLAAALLAGLFVNMGWSMPTPSSKETFMQKSVGAPTSGSGMGPYDGVSVDGVSGWGSTEPHSAAPIGVAGLPSQSSDNQLMFLVGNKTDSQCCPAAFNTDSGCVCLTDDNKRLMASRAGNRA